MYLIEHFIVTPTYSYTNNNIFLIENGYAFGYICLYKRKLGKVKLSSAIHTDDLYGKTF